jgi:hypothetical protein
MFDEISVRHKLSFDPFFSLVSHGYLPASTCASVVVPNPVPKADSFVIAVRSWPS